MRRTAWHLAELMAQRGISSASELSRQLTKAGHEVTPTHTARIVKERPGKLDMELLEALLAVLNCTVGDLLDSAPPGATADTTAAKQAMAEVALAPVAVSDEQEEQPEVTEPAPAPLAAVPEPEEAPAVAAGTGNATGQKSSARRQAINLPPTPLF